MATFKAVVQQHQLRRDGKYPVSIRITHNRKSCYVPTGLYCKKSQINQKTFEIKDQFVIARTAQTIMGYEQKLLTVNTADLQSMSGEELKLFLTLSANSIDYLGYCQKLVDNDPEKWGDLKHAIALIREMGIDNMTAMDFTSHFIRRFREYMDNKQLPVTKNSVIVSYKPYAQNTKRSYLVAVCQVFRMLQRQYNTEFNKVIYHDPFISFENYKHAVTTKRSMPVERLRVFLGLHGRTKKQQLTLDMMKLSFCLCGINLMDLLVMEKSSFDRETMRLTYERHKTKDSRSDHALTSVRIEPEIYDLIEKYLAPNDSERLFVFGNLKPNASSTRLVACRTARTCKSLGFEHVTPYWFRHTWATIARNDCDISKDDIDLCLVHVGNNPMADVYIRPDWSRIDKANRKVLDLVFGEQEKLQ
ncbi:MAG: hypothetical protein IJ640_00010 [Prevotella sp.]|nr:hypothetical protein [Prevotella sp.]